MKAACFRLAGPLQQADVVVPKPLLDCFGHVLEVMRPGPWAEKHPHNMMLPPPCFTGEGGGVAGLVCSPCPAPDIFGGVMPKKFNFCLI